MVTLGCVNFFYFNFTLFFTTESNQSNWEEEFDKVEEEINQTRLEQDIELEIYKLDVGVDHEVSKQMMIDCLVDYCGYDAETVNKVIDNIKGIDWKYDAESDRIIEKYSKINKTVLKTKFIDYLSNATSKDKRTYWVEKHKDYFLIKLFVRADKFVHAVISHLKYRQSLRNGK